jgi:predicted site-specific integrase-resolvase
MVRRMPKEIQMNKNRVAIYARVSTVQAQDPEMQLSELREYAGRRGWHVIGEYLGGHQGKHFSFADQTYVR